MGICSQLSFKLLQYEERGTNYSRVNAPSHVDLSNFLLNPSLCYKNDFLGKQCN